ncbi:hypothetical protein AB0O52_22965 [Arthrobacter sp. NPDC080073]|uniref:hypothetical protein n=1 Tax=Arthrobacter sp. NPDC080073 TaxID=3155919 RepID=UPI0034305804
MESFFALLQKNVLNQRSLATRDELRLAIIHRIERTSGLAPGEVGAWIEDRYNRRRHSQIGNVTPIDFELQYSTSAPSSTSRITAYPPTGGKANRSATRR